MGARLSRLASNAHWSRTLSANGLILLYYMAARTLDTDSPRGQLARRYFAGQEELMIALTGDVPEHGTKEYRNARERVKRAIADLIRNGAVKRVRMATGGNRAEYEIRPDHFQDELPEDDQ